MSTTNHGMMRPLMKSLVAAILILMAISPADGVTNAPGDGTERPKILDTTAPGTTTSVAAALTNTTEQVRGLQFTASPLAAAVSLRGVHAVGRSEGLTADAQQQADGTIRVVLMSLDARTIAPGQGAVVSLDLATDATASGDAIAIDPASVRVAGSSGPLATSLEGETTIVTEAQQQPGTTHGGGGCMLSGPSSRVRLHWMLLAGIALALLHKRWRRVN